MNQLIRELQRLAEQNVLAPKWLLAPSRRVGHQWIDVIARGGQPAVNFHVLTVQALALEIAGPQIAARQQRLLTSSAGKVLIDSILGREVRTYLNQAESSSNLSQAILRSIQTLRLAGLGPDDLSPDHFEVDRKGADLRTLLEAYVRQLEDWRVVDQADVLTLAIDRLRHELFALPDELMVLVPDTVDATGLAGSLLSAIPAHKRRHLPIGGMETPHSDRCLLRWLREPTEAPAPFQDQSVEIFRAVGAVNEVREVLRRCVGTGVNMDDVEVLHTNKDIYIPLFYELAHRLTPAVESNSHVPVTFAEGIPASYGRPGRALRAWLSWIDQDFDQQALVRMLHEGLVAVDAGKAAIAFSSLTAILRQIGIGRGRDRYLPRIDEQLKAAQQQRKALGVEEDDAGSVVRLDRRIAALKILRKVVARLLRVSDDHLDAGKLLGHALEFLQQIARSVNEVDNYSREAIVQEIQTMREWVALAGPSEKLNLLGWLRDLPDQVRILGSGPRPGCLHVSHVHSGGHSGRSQTFIIGCDDSRFPGSPTQDPLLLDRERGRLSKDLVKSSDQLEESLRAFVRNLTRLPGKVTFSYPCVDLVDDRELFPSSIVLSAFRIVSGKHDADLHDLDNALAAPSSFASEDSGRVLDDAEWWLSRLCGGQPVREPLPVIGRCFPHLARGRQAVTARQSSGLTPFDGYVPDAGTDFDPTTSARVFSASGLETAGLCGLKYFFSYPLYIRPLDELIVDPERWLDALTFGHLLHSVFRQFMAGLRQQDLIPEFARDEQTMSEILRSHIKQYRETVPPPNEAAFRKQCRELTWAAKVFLETESVYCQQHRPEYFEASIGLTAEDEGTDLDEVDPVEVMLPSGQSVKTRGRIDRIDRVGTEFSICDYKTGSSRKYDKADPFRQGRVVQSAIYMGIVEPALRRNVNPEAVVQSFNYFFPGGRTWGERISWTRKELGEGRSIIQRLCQLIANGAFLPTDDANDCNYCDYRSVCGDVWTSAPSVRKKIDNQDNLPLIPLRELRRSVK